LSSMIELPQPTAEEATESTDSLKEAAALSADIDLSNREKLNQFNSLGRGDLKEDHIHKVTVCGIYVVGAACLVMFLMLVSEYTLPHAYRLLTDDESNKLQSFLFSGTIGGILAGAGSRLSKPK
jgi:hypothetical protein